MFARTARLLLRPVWTEDAALIASVIQQPVCRAILATRSDPIFSHLLVFERTEAAPRLIGACSLRRVSPGVAEPRIWITPEHRGRGLGKEVQLALLDIARGLNLRVPPSGNGRSAEPAQLRRAEREASPQSLAA